jgi:integrase
MKRSQIKRRPLADSVIHNLEPEDKVYQEKDSPGLYLRVKPSGGKSWMFRYKKPDGKWGWKGAGGFPAVSGKLARQKARDWQDILSDGGTFEVDTGRHETVSTFGEAAEQWFQRKLDIGRAKDSIDQYRRYLDMDIYAVIPKGTPLDEVTRLMCANVQARIEKRKAYTMAEKVRRWLNQILSLAVGQGLCENNPASELKQIAIQKPKITHYPHLLEPELPAFLKALRESSSKRLTLILTRLVLRTACRPGMARFAEWSEMDLENGWWLIPGDKMKTGEPHSIPLSRQTLEDLRELQEITGRNKWMFPGYGAVNPTMSENTVNKCLSLVGYKGKLVGHGSRHTASTLLNEYEWDDRIVEAQLAHKVQGVKGVYNKAKYLEIRKGMMQWYSDYLDYLEFGGEKPVKPM